MTPDNSIDVLRDVANLYVDLSNAISHGKKVYLAVEHDRVVVKESSVWNWLCCNIWSRDSFNIDTVLKTLKKEISAMNNDQMRGYNQCVRVVQKLAELLESPEKVKNAGSGKTYYARMAAIWRSAVKPEIQEKYTSVLNDPTKKNLDTFLEHVLIHQHVRTPEEERITSIVPYTIKEGTATAAQEVVHGVKKEALITAEGHVTPESTVAVLHAAALGGGESVQVVRNAPSIATSVVVQPPTSEQITLKTPSSPVAGGEAATPQSIPQAAPDTAVRDMPAIVATPVALSPPPNPARERIAALQQKLEAVANNPKYRAPTGSGVALERSLFVRMERNLQACSQALDAGADVVTTKKNELRELDAFTTYAQAAADCREDQVPQDCSESVVTGYLKLVLNETCEKALLLSQKRIQALTEAQDFDSLQKIKKDLVAELRKKSETHDLQRKCETVFQPYEAEQGKLIRIVRTLRNKSCADELVNVIEQYEELMVKKCSPSVVEFHRKGMNQSENINSLAPKFFNFFDPIRKTVLAKMQHHNVAATGLNKIVHEELLDKLIKANNKFVVSKAEHGLKITETQYNDTMVNLRAFLQVANECDVYIKHPSYAKVALYARTLLSIIVKVVDAKPAVVKCSETMKNAILERVNALQTKLNNVDLRNTKALKVVISEINEQLSTELQGTIRKDLQDIGWDEEVTDIRFKPINTLVTAFSQMLRSAQHKKN